MKGEFGWKRNIKAVLKPAPAGAQGIKVKCLKVKEKDMFCKRKRERAEKISDRWSQARK